MSRELPFDARPLSAGDRAYDPRAGVLRRRRAQAARVRRRRLVAADIAAGVVLALAGIVIAPGLAILAIAALLTLCGCGVWVLAGRLRGARRRKRGPGSTA